MINNKYKLLHPNFNEHMMAKFLWELDPDWAKTPELLYKALKPQ